MTREELEKALEDSEVCRCEQNAKIEELAARLQAASAIRRDTYSEAVRAYGKQSQLVMAMEEMSELTKELSKNIRGEKNVSAISEEIADVEIMMEQLKVIYGNRAEVDRVRGEKLERLFLRLTEKMS